MKEKLGEHLEKLGKFEKRRSSWVGAEWDHRTSEQRAEKKSMTGDLRNQLYQNFEFFHSQSSINLGPKPH